MHVKLQDGRPGVKRIVGLGFPQKAKLLRQERHRAVGNGDGDGGLGLCVLVMTSSM